jgi:unsaturated chondroitin disaccharide hydrolase
MMHKTTRLFTAILFVLTMTSYSLNAMDTLNIQSQLDYCNRQIKRTLVEIKGDSCLMPRSINNNFSKWSLVNIYDWTSGFWPGILWYGYEITQDEKIKEKAIAYTECLAPLTYPEHGCDHDIGFQIFCSFGNAYRQTQNEAYKEKILKSAEKLTKLYNPVVGTILSWPAMRETMNWPHNTILDNMMNLEILFWASKNGGKKEWYDMAVRHARVTMHNQFRADGSSFHVAVYDTLNGNFIKGVTNQGYNDNSLWARGQAWSIYGYTMVYRETGDPEFLRFVEKITDIYLKRLPKDYVPYWDFDDPAIPNAPKDASSAAIVSSALLELSQLEDNEQKANEYKTAALKMLESLSSDAYRNGKTNASFIRHSVGNYPGGYEINASINYADYYYLEALVRYKKILENKTLFWYNKAAVKKTYPFGVNLAGAEFGHRVPAHEGQLDVHYFYPTTDDLDYWKSKNLLLIRLPFKWERIQKELNGPLYDKEVERIIFLLQEAQKRGMQILLDAHNYGRRKVNGKDRIIGEDSLRIEDFTNLWGRLAQALQPYKNSIYGYGLINEPHDMLDAVAPWAKTAQATILEIRKYDAETPIVVGGNHWSSAMVWDKVSADLKNLYDPADNLIFEAHLYFDEDGSGVYRRSYDEEKANPYIGIERVQPFVKWLKENNKRGLLGECGIPADDERWLVCLNNFFAYLQEKGINATYWAAGAQWGKYPLSVQPTNNYQQDRPQVKILTKYLKTN